MPCARIPNPAKQSTLPVPLILASLTLGGALLGCADPDAPAQQPAGTDVAIVEPDNVYDGFLANLNALCGLAFEGVVLDAPDTDPAFNPGDPMVMHIRQCDPHEVRVPVWMGEDASRTFVFTRHPQGLDVRHDHRHSDGRPEPNTLYGAASALPPVAEEPPSATRMEFKRVNDEGFRTGWIAELFPGEKFLYGTQRNGEWRHHFEFDLTNPIDPPGDPWGYPPLGTVPDIAAPQEAFWDHLSQHCGQAFAGELVRIPEGSQTFTGEEEDLIVHFRECEDTRLKLPFHVDDDHSRTWVFIKTTAGLDLRHDHRIENGAPDPQSTWYGAHTWDDGTENRQEFLREELTNGVQTGWRVEIIPGERYTYGTIRDGEWNFRADFDLSTPVDLPPAPWGH